MPQGKETSTSKVSTDDSGFSTLRHHFFQARELFGGFLESLSGNLALLDFDLIFVYFRKLAAFGTELFLNNAHFFAQIVLALGLFEIEADFVMNLLFEVG